MISQDYQFLISQMGKRIEELEERVLKGTAKPSINDQDWDNATLILEWKICERSAATYRKQGLRFYKRGGRVFYTPEARAEFQLKRTQHGSN